MNEWISVKERLPEKSGKYLTISPSGIYSILNYSAKYRAFNIYDEQPKSSLKYCLEVTHWMPLPAAPKEEGENT
jgi:hypothetical protein